MAKSKYRALSNQELTDRVINLEDKNKSDFDSLWAILIIAIIFGDFGKNNQGFCAMPTQDNVSADNKKTK